MDCRIIWSPEALNHLEQVIRYISRDNPEAAIKLGNEIIEKCIMLSSFPRFGKVFRNLRLDTFREISVPPYRIFYEINDPEKQIEIVSIWHGARKEPKFR